MSDLREWLRARLDAALAEEGFVGADAGLSPASDARFGDYQSNAAMTLARAARANPREIAARLAARVDASGLESPPEIAGPGFLNFRVARRTLEEFLTRMDRDDRLGLAPASSPRTVLLDFSSPNVAKPMHVGHIRSTILGDCLARVARFVGHRVITDNHIGDWGTQFGKVIYGYKHLLDPQALEHDPIAELVRLYREVNARETEDPAIAAAARAELVKLQQGDPENLGIWRRCVELSWKEFEKLYRLLDISFDERLGESAYNHALAPLCERMEKSGLARISDGALCVFFPEIAALADKPAIIRKADGGFLYATTDLATLEYRMARWNPDAIWYVVGAPQQLHFQQVFAAAKKLGISCELAHIAFGSILGEDRKIMKTRSGENIGLAEVLEEARVRARALVDDKNPDLPEEERASIAHQLGIGAVKYAELSQNRMTDYVFSWDKLLAFHGNTAPYLQNAAVRIGSIFRKAGDTRAGEISLAEPPERALGMHLARYPETIPLVLEDFRPNLLANYLYQLAEEFHAFYEACPVLKAGDPVRGSRLALCALTHRVLTHGLGLMGIQCPERM